MNTDKLRWRGIFASARRTRTCLQIDSHEIFERCADLHWEKLCRTFLRRQSAARGLK